MNKLKNINLNPPVFLAPMAGITDTPSREIAKLFRPGLVVSEMIASSEHDKEYFQDTVKANLSGKKSKSCKCPTAIQIAGHEIAWMSFAAKVVESEGGDLVDINMGCPAKKIVGKLAGSALMKEPLHALKMIESIVNSTDLPVTLKMRLGWDIDQINAPSIAKSAENTGVQIITVHARTRNLFFKGEPDWSLVRAVKEAVSIPVVVNGNIVDSGSAKEAINKSFADGVMIGRGAIGKPWLISHLSKSVYGITAENIGHDIPMSELVKLHFHKSLEYYGEKIGLRIFRKHLGNYLKNVELDPRYYQTLMTEVSITSLEEKIQSVFLGKKVTIFND